MPLTTIAGRVGWPRAPQAGLATAQRRITIASLYLGTGDGREAEFADALEAAAADTSRPHLRVRLLLDALRSTRPTSGSSSAGREPAALTSTAEMLATRLLEGQAPPAAPDGQPRVAVSLFHTPALRGLLKRWGPAQAGAGKRRCRPALPTADHPQAAPVPACAAQGAAATRVRGGGGDAHEGVLL